MENMSLDKDLIQLAITTNDWQIIYSLLRENALVRMVIAGREIVDEALAMFWKAIYCGLLSRQIW